MLAFFALLVLRLLSFLANLPKVARQSSLYLAVILKSFKSLKNQLRLKSDLTFVMGAIALFMRFLMWVGKYSFYVGLQQALINDDEGNAKFGVYTRIGWVPSGRASDNNFYADFGFNWFAPIPCRENDIFAVGFSVIENERAARAEYSHYEGALEITYRVQITPAIAVQPDLQIYVNQGEDSQAAYIAGARLEVNF